VVDDIRVLSWKRWLNIPNSDKDVKEVVDDIRVLSSGSVMSGHETCGMAPRLSFYIVNYIYIVNGENGACPKLSIQLTFHTTS
jgi:hypothetical protein